MDSERYLTLTKIKEKYDAAVTPDMMIAEYDNWASKYENDYETIGYKVPWFAAETLLKHMDPAKIRDGKIIDVACGTGLVGSALRKIGFGGMLHGIDGSKSMLSVADEKGHYDQLICQMMCPEQPIPTPCKYDALTFVGGFSKNHFTAEIMVRLVELVTAGGLICFSIRDSEDNAILLERLEHELAKLTALQTVEEICRVQTTHGVNWNVEANSNETSSNSSLLHVFVLRKI